MSRLRGFQDLMRHRVRDIILVSSLYDSFILAEDGQLDELLLTEFLNHDLRHTPDLVRVSTGAEALALASRQRGHNLIITSTYVGDMSAGDLARRVREAGLETPVVALAYDSRDTDPDHSHAAAGVDRLFLWQGDVRILLAIVNYVEDRLNVAHDTGEVGVQAIIVIEDSVPFYSSFLPTIYSELLHHSHRLAPEGLNRSQRLLRVQARPKVLLCGTFEEAWQYFSAYQTNILGVISDIEFPRGGVLDPEAGVAFARQVRALQPDVSIMLQSSAPENEALAQAVGAGFLLKGSPRLLHQLSQFMVENFGFGDFVFRDGRGAEVDRAGDLKGLEDKLRSVPAESVAYHASRNHFSIWLKARTEFELAHSLRPRKVEDFPTVDALRWNLVAAVQEYRDRRNRTVVADFDRQTFDAGGLFYRIGGGSLGGKARGLAFVNVLLEEHGVRDRFPGVAVSVPRSVVLGTDVFDQFLGQEDLREFAIDCRSDEEIGRRFQASPLPGEIVRDLETVVDLIRYPLAVRSSSLLEDSQYQPFAGIYHTYMLANNHPDRAVRLAHLIEAVKRVYASTFSRQAKAYVAGTPYRLEEEKMAVIVQKLVGGVHGPRFYPDFAGVARSHNFYPTAPLRSEDGIAAVALGLGATVVNGEPCVRFCPKYPRNIVQLSSTRDIVRNSQRIFRAVALDGEAGPPGAVEEAVLAQFGLDVAEADGTLAAVGSTYSAENDAVYDGISRPGLRLVTLAPVLKHGVFPLPEILHTLLDISEKGASTPVELEFAVDLSSRAPKEFGFLQLRPLALSRELAELQIDGVDQAAVLCRSASVLGNGRMDLRDVVVVDVHRFDRGRSQDVAQDVARFNAELMAERRPYLLIGVGRWGSSEPLLGIPVSWDQIAGARAIVEAGFKDFKVTPSQGTHFFQNLTSANVGYFTVNPEAGEGFVDWAWLTAQPAKAETPFVRHLRLDAPVVVKMNGKTNAGVILKPMPNAE
jgi:CheY-like chemotaxis protein